MKEQKEMVRRPISLVLPRTKIMKDIIQNERFYPSILSESFSERRYRIKDGWHLLMEGMRRHRHHLRKIWHWYRCRRDTPLLETNGGSLVRKGKEGSRGWRRANVKERAQKDKSLKTFWRGCVQGKAEKIYLIFHCHGEACFLGKILNPSAPPPLHYRAPTSMMRRRKALTVSWFYI